MTRKYLKLEFWFQVSSISKQIISLFFWEKLRLDNFVSRSTDLPDWPLVTIFLPTLNLEVFTFLKLCPIFVSSKLLLQLSVTDELSSSLTWLFTIIDWEDFIISCQKVTKSFSKLIHSHSLLNLASIYCHFIRKLSCKLSQIKLELNSSLWQIQSLKIAIVFELIYYTNGHF